MSDAFGQGTAETPGAFGSAANGWVRVELHEDGRIGDVVLDARAMTMPVAQLSAALVDALQQAQDAIRAQGEAVARDYGGLPSRERLQAVADDVTAAAERRFAEISTVLYDLDRRVGRER